MEMGRSRKVAKTADARLPIIKITRVLPFVCAVHLFGVLAWLNLNTSDDQHTSRLAESFLQWKLVLLPSVPMSWGDTALFQGHHYSPFGPFPAILSMPLVWAGYFHQGALSFVASLAVFYLCFRLAGNFNYSRNEAGWFALAFCFATSFIGVAALACSAFFAHVIAVMLLFLAINEYEGRKRLWLIGGFIGLATATRLPNGLNILFFMLGVSLGAGTIQERAAEPFEITASVCGLRWTTGSLQLRALWNSAGIGLYLPTERFRYALCVVECTWKHGGISA